jgi:uncharacterized protein
MNTTYFWALLFAQIAMGAFDTLYHHELTQRLAWKPGQANELRLHGVRNMLYAVVFLGLAWTTPQGAWAWALMAILLIELGITLCDFVEEDRVRLLPATERITHTLLTLNYGVILALWLPTLWADASAPTQLALINHGIIISGALTVAALGVVISGVRDLFAAARSERLTDTDAKALACALTTSPHDKPLSILITGGTGFIGSRLVAALVAAGHDVTVLTRGAASTKGLPLPHRLISDLAQLHDSFHCDAVVNLAGEPIANGLWTKVKRARIVSSRIEMTQALNALFERLQTKPKVLINGSAIGFYGVRDASVRCDESTNPGEGFCADVCQRWEHEAARAERFGIRVVRLRIGLVLGRAGGMLANMLFSFECGMGVRFGDGQHVMSWIHRDDVVRLICFAIATPSLQGAVNATAPNPCTNAAFTKALGGALSRPALLAASAFALRFAAGDMADELLLGGQFVVPSAATAKGFRFAYADIDSALRECVGAKINPSHFLNAMNEEAKSFR